MACYGGFEAKAALRPFERWDFAFGHKITDVFFMALARAIVFPLLTRLAVRCGRRDGCLCAKKPAAPEGYAALEGEERTGAAAARGGHGGPMGAPMYTKHPDLVPMAQPAKTQKVLGNGFPTGGFG